jgi:hypothetical protein
LTCRGNRDVEVPYVLTAAGFVVLTHRGPLARICQPQARGDVIALDSCPMIFASTVEEIPHEIIREAKAWRIEWKVTPSIPASSAAVRSRGAFRFGG